ncbi:FtsX-like permease family protein [Oculatella sp. FACHB-28]|uniref:ABC transporter permease DevC n=1 Tax=Cyanophyceae TaxID=3028117 RepID=UPI0016842AC2|nr:MULTISPECIES: ABC transporter permease DevC [Cyanophyceae]MBD1868065.1 FtsX-like permease family protein [Cyanobacteria bacterium FACHB-471]MBD2001446.1 FtsX-like permease family protein [Leptolyngbya sp. FACHB-541]MBD2054726.1 FtsX-like permease family protein [Oculatella sp. FACHB-28]MBD2069696.1 FtsX-like permease family protein [Leptolyngbya sp. FACHB-671]
MLRNLFRKTPLAWFQLKREKTRLAVALAGIAFADILMFFQLGLLDALFESVVKPYTSLQGDLFLINPLFESLNVVRSFPRQQLYQAAGAKEVESINYLYIGQGEWRNAQTRKNQPTMVFAINPHNSAITLPDVQAHQNELKLLNRMLYDRAGAEQFFGNVVEELQQSGSVPIQFNNFQVEVVGTFVMGASFAANGNVITSHSTFLRLFPARQPDEIDIGAIQLKPGTDVEQFKAAMQSELKGVLILTHEEFIAHEKKYWETTSPIGILFGFGAIIGFIVGTIIVYQILYSDVSDHLPEYATLKAMGYSDGYLIGVLIQEALIMAVLGFIPGFIISVGLYSVAAAATFLPIGMTLSRAMLVLTLTIVMCAASGGIAMRKLQSADPADIF